MIFSISCFELMLSCIIFIFQWLISFSTSVELFPEFALSTLPSSTHSQNLHCGVLELFSQYESVSEWRRKEEELNSHYFAYQWVEANSKLLAIVMRSLRSLHTRRKITKAWMLIIQFIWSGREWRRSRRHSWRIAIRAPKWYHLLLQSRMYNATSFQAT